MWLVNQLDRFPAFREWLMPLVASDTRRRIVKGAFWGGMASFTTRCVALAVSFLLARLVGKERFGEYGMINNTAVTIGGLAGFGIGMTVVKYVAELKNKDKERIGRIIALSTVVTSISAVAYLVLFVTFAPWIAIKTLAAPHLAPMLQISSIAVALGIVNSVQVSSLTGCEAFKMLSTINIINSIVQSVLVLLGAWLWGIKGAVWMFSVTAVIVVCVTRCGVSREWKRLGITVRWKNFFQEWKVLLHFSLPTFLAGISVGPIVWGCSALLANQENGYDELGIYNAANQWQTAIQFLPGLIGVAFLPILTERFGNGKGKEGIGFMLKMMKLVGIIVFPLVIIISMLSPLIMRGYGETFVNGYKTLVIAVVTAGLLAVMTPVGQVIAASGKMWIGFWMNVGWGLCMLGFTWLFVRWGAEGVAGARLLAYLIHAMWTFGFVVYINRERREKVFA